MKSHAPLHSIEGTVCGSLRGRKFNFHVFFKIFVYIEKKMNRRAKNIFMMAIKYFSIEIYNTFEFHVAKNICIEIELGKVVIANYLE